MAKVYPYISGVTSTITDGGLTFTPTTDTRTKILVVGTATDGISDTPVQVEDLDLAYESFGGKASFETGTLLKGAFEILASNSSNIDFRFMRVGNGQKSSLIIPSEELIEERFVGTGATTLLRVNNIIGELKGDRYNCHVYRTLQATYNSDGSLNTAGDISKLEDIKHLVTVDEDKIILPDTDPAGTVYIVKYRPMSLRLEAIKKSRIYNNVSFLKSKVGEFAGIPTIRIYNPKTGVNSDFNIDESALGTDIYDIKNVNDLVDAINNDDNLNTDITASTQTITATDVFKVNYSTDGGIGSVSLGIGGYVNSDNTISTKQTVRELVVANSPMTLNVPAGTVAPIVDNEILNVSSTISNVSDDANNGFSSLQIKSIKKLASGYDNTFYSSTSPYALDDAKTSDILAALNLAGTVTSLADVSLTYDPTVDVNPSDELVGSYQIDVTGSVAGDIFYVEYEVEVISYSTIYGTTNSDARGNMAGTDLTSGRTTTGGANKLARIASAFEIKTKKNVLIPLGVKEVDLGELVVPMGGNDKIIAAKRRPKLINQHVNSPITISITDFDSSKVADASNLKVLYVKNETKDILFSSNVAEAASFSVDYSLVTQAGSNVTFKIDMPDNDDLVVSTDNITVIYEYPISLTEAANGASLSTETEYFISGTVLSLGVTAQTPILVDYMYKDVYVVGTDIVIEDDNAKLNAIVSFLGNKKPGMDLDSGETSLLSVTYEYLPEFPNVTVTDDYGPVKMTGGSDGAVLTNEQLYSELEKAYQTLENYDVDMVFVKGIFLDSTKTVYNKVTGLPQQVPAGFEKQLNGLLDQMSARTSGTVGFIPVLPSAKTDLPSINAWSARCEFIQNNDVTAPANIMALNNAPGYDLRYVSVLALPTVQYTHAKVGTWYGDASAGYISLLATLPTSYSTTAKAIPGNVTPLFSLSNVQRNNIGSNRMVSGEIVNGRLVISSGIVGGYNNTIYYSNGTVKSFDQSDFTSISTIRITTKAVEVVRNICRGFLGLPNSTENRLSMDNAIEQGLKGMVPDELEAFDHQIISTANQRVLGEASVKLSLKENLELKVVNITTSLY